MGRWPIRIAGRPESGGDGRCSILSRRPTQSFSSSSSSFFLPFSETRGEGGGRGLAPFPLSSKVFCAETGRILARIETLQSPFRSFLLDKDGKIACPLKINNIERGVLLHSMKCISHISPLFSPFTSFFLSTADGVRTVHPYADTAGRREKWTTEPAAPPHPVACCFCPRGMSLAAPPFLRGGPTQLTPEQKSLLLPFFLFLSAARVHVRKTRVRRPIKVRRRNESVISSPTPASNAEAKKETNYPPPSSTHLSTHTFKMKVRENPCFVGDFNAGEILPALDFIFIAVPCLLRFVLAPCY